MTWHASPTPGRVNSIIFLYIDTQYNISQGELENRTLWLTVWHNDRLGRNDFLGEVTIPMDTYRFGDSTPKTYPLQSRVLVLLFFSFMAYTFYVQNLSLSILLKAGFMVICHFCMLFFFLMKSPKDRSFCLTTNGQHKREQLITTPHWDAGGLL